MSSYAEAGTGFLTGWTQELWGRGIWFSENDVLHIGLIAWMLYLALVVARRVEDLNEMDPSHKNNSEE